MDEETMIVKPNPTLYISNIDWKIKKSLLKRALYSLFTRHGKVLEIVTLRKDGLRGQAWVIMDDVQSATVALQAENGVSFFGRDIKIAYAKETSTRIAKRDGTYSSKAVKQSKKKGNEPTDEIVANEAPVSDQTAQSSTPFAPPSHLLLAQDLPEDVTQEMLQVLFQPYSGFKEARLPRPGLAFIEFESEAHATLARKGLNGFQLTPSDQLKLDYGKA